MNIDVTMIAGQRGSGKSTLARKLASAWPRAVVIDPAGDWARLNWGVSCKDGAALSRAIFAAHPDRPFRAIYSPRNGYGAAALDRISATLLTYQQGYRASHGREGAPVCLVIDEAAACFSNADAARPGNSFSTVLLQGRHYGIAVIAITQRPVDVATRLRDMVANLHSFRLTTQGSVDAIRAAHVKAASLDLSGLPPFRFYTITQEGVTGPHSTDRANDQARPKRMRGRSATSAAT